MAVIGSPNSNDDYINSKTVYVSADDATVHQFSVENDFPISSVEKLRPKQKINYEYFDFPNNKWVKAYNYCEIITKINIEVSKLISYRYSMYEDNDSEESVNLYEISTNGGLTYNSIPLNDIPQSEPYVAMSLNGKYVYVSFNNDIDSVYTNYCYKSDDYGKTFKKISYFETTNTKLDNIHVSDSGQYVICKFSSVEMVIQPSIRRTEPFIFEEPDPNNSIDPYVLISTDYGKTFTSVFDKYVYEFSLFFMNYLDIAIGPDDLPTIEELLMFDKQSIMSSYYKYADFRTIDDCNVSKDGKVFSATSTNGAINYILLSLDYGKTFSFKLSFDDSQLVQ